MNAIQMRNPIIPPRLGLNIYGEMSRLVLLGASGGLMMGYQDYSLNNADVELIGHTAPDKGDGFEFITFNFEEGRFELAVKFSSRGRASINEKEITSLWLRVQQHLGIIELMGVVLGFRWLFLSFMAGDNAFSASCLTAQLAA